MTLLARALTILVLMLIMIDSGYCTPTYNDRTGDFRCELVSSMSCGVLIVQCLCLTNNSRSPTITGAEANSNSSKSHGHPVKVSYRLSGSKCQFCCSLLHTLPCSRLRIYFAKRALVYALGISDCNEGMGSVLLEMLCPRHQASFQDNPYCVIPRSLFITLFMRYVV
jgi:hypothetical protein